MMSYQKLNDSTLLENTVLAYFLVSLQETAKPNKFVACLHVAASAYQSVSQTVKMGVPGSH